MTKWQGSRQPGRYDRNLHHKLLTVILRALPIVSLWRPGDEALTSLWRLKVMGRLQIERNRADVFRDFILSHLIHHRGQFSVYLRLLDVPVPGSYGPTVDEQA